MRNFLEKNKTILLEIRDHCQRKTQPLPTNSFSRAPWARRFNILLQIIFVWFKLHFLKGSEAVKHLPLGKTCWSLQMSVSFLRFVQWVAFAMNAYNIQFLISQAVYRPIFICSTDITVKYCTFLCLSGPLCFVMSFVLIIKITVAAGLGNSVDWTGLVFCRSCSMSVESEWKAPQYPQELSLR